MKCELKILVLVIVCYILVLNVKFYVSDFVEWSLVLFKVGWIKGVVNDINEKKFIEKCIK